MFKIRMSKIRMFKIGMIRVKYRMLGVDANWLNLLQ